MVNKQTNLKVTTLDVEGQSSIARSQKELLGRAQWLLKIWGCILGAIKTGDLDYTVIDKKMSLKPRGS